MLRVCSTFTARFSRINGAPWGSDRSLVSESVSLVPVQPQAEQGCTLMHMAHPCVWYPINFLRALRLSNLRTARATVSLTVSSLQVPLVAVNQAVKGIVVKETNISRVGQQLRQVTAHLHLAAGTRANPNIAMLPHVLIIDLALTTRLTSSRIARVGWLHMVWHWPTEGPYKLLGAPLPYLRCRPIHRQSGGRSCHSQSATPPYYIPRAQYHVLASSDMPTQQHVNNINS